MCNNIDVEPRSYTLEALIVRENVIHNCYPFDRAEGSFYACPCLGDTCCTLSPACHNGDCNVLCCSPQRLSCIFGIFALCAPIVGTAGCLRNCFVGEPCQGLLECANGIQKLFAECSNASYACCCLPHNFDCIIKKPPKFINGEELTAGECCVDSCNTYFCDGRYIFREKNKLDNPLRQQQRWIDITFLRHDAMTEQWKKESLYRHYARTKVDERMVNLLIKHGTLSELFFKETAQNVNTEEEQKRNSSENGVQESANLKIMKAHLRYWPHLIDSISSDSLAYQAVLKTNILQNYYKDLINTLNDASIFCEKSLAGIVVDYIICNGSHEKKHVAEKEDTEREVIEKGEAQFINSEEWMASLERYRKDNKEHNPFDNRTDILTFHQPDNDQLEGERTYMFEGTVPVEQHMS